MIGLGPRRAKSRRVSEKRNCAPARSVFSTQCEIPRRPADAGLLGMTGQTGFSAACSAPPGSRLPPSVGPVPRAACAGMRSFGVRQQAAAFRPASLLAGISAEGTIPRQQAGSSQSGSKLPHSKAQDDSLKDGCKPVTAEHSRGSQPVRHGNFAYSALAWWRMGMSGSASFHSVKKSL